MMILERSIIARFLKVFLVTLSISIWLILIITVPEKLTQGDDLFEPLVIKEILARITVALEIAVAITAPLSMTITLLRLKSQGILNSFFSAGYRLQRVRTLILLLASLNVMISAIIFEATYRMVNVLMPPKTAKTWSAARVNICSPNFYSKSGDVKKLILFRSNTLDVTWVDSIKKIPNQPSFSILASHSLFGPTIALDKIPEPPKRKYVFANPPVTKWFDSAVRINEALPTINRIFLGGILFVICSYLALLITEKRQWSIYIWFLLFVPAGALGMIFGSVLLWQGKIMAYAFECLWFGAITFLIIALDSRLRKQGIRLE